MPSPSCHAPRGIMNARGGSSLFLRRNRLMSPTSIILCMAACFVGLVAALIVVNRFGSMSTRAGGHRHDGRRLRRAQYRRHDPSRLDQHFRFRPAHHRRRSALWPRRRSDGRSGRCLPRSADDLRRHRDHRAVDHPPAVRGLLIGLYAKRCGYELCASSSSAC